MSDRPEIDPVTRTELKPHEWDGIRELDTAPPRWWILTYAAMIVVSVGYWVVYPAWPTLDGFTRGAFGWSSRGAVADDLKAAELSRAGRSEEHTSELQSLMRISYAVFCSKTKNTLTYLIKKKTNCNHI